MNILVTLNKKYIPYFNVMLSSLLKSNPQKTLMSIFLHTGVKKEDISYAIRLISGRGRIIMVCADDIGLDFAPVASRYPKEIYYRIFAARYLPTDINRVLYLDPDIVVNGSIEELYSADMDGFYFAAATHVGRFLRGVNAIRLGMTHDAHYINSGVMLMNLELLRNEQNFEDVFTYIKRKCKCLILPDQDVISALYGGKIMLIDALKYNMTERVYRRKKMLRKINLDWVRKNSVLIHYIGKNKPWKSDYRGKLDVFYKEALKGVNTRGMEVN